MAPNTPLSAESFAAIRASATCLTWKRAGDLPPQLRVLQDKCPTSGSPSIQLSYVAVFPPAGTPLRGVVLFIHGINEHSERYFHLFEDLCEMGFGTIAYDLRSHGKSQMDVAGLVGHVERFPELINDTNDFVTFAKREIYAKMGVRPEEKLVLMGMSLGTLVSVHTVLSERHSFAGMVLAAPAVSVEMTFVLSVMKLVSGLLSSLLPRARLVPGVNEQWLCRDPLRLADYKADPLTTSEPVTCRMGAETLASMEELQRDLRVEDPQSPFCALPLLMIMGSEDKVTSLPLAKQFYDRLATRDKQFELVDGAFHALVDDFDRPRVVATIQQWLFQRFPLPQ